MYRTYFFLLHILFLALASCAGEQVSNKLVLSSEEESKLQETIMKDNQRYVGKESEMINSFVVKNNLTMKTTGTGLRYQIESDGKGSLAQPEMLAKVNYTITLLDGTLCYSSDSTGAVTFRVDHDDVESGLHEGIKLMRVGDRAKFILPSHLAYGLTGDQNKIPPRTPIIYQIELIQLN
jgi:FKBP-type peptidyl-prolyl cis-trans isomerase FkpA